MRSWRYALLGLVLWPFAQVYKSYHRLLSLIQDVPRILLCAEPFECGWQEKLKSLRGEAKLAFVSATPDGIVCFSLKNLLSALAECGFATVLTVGPKDDVSKLIGDNKRITVIRRAARCGRDFGVWKHLILWLRSDIHNYNNVDALLLANDSLYFTRQTSELIREIEGSPHSWSCLYESFVPFYHPQSFFLLFKRPSLQLSAFSDFWRNYVPLENRRHLISKGEINLGQVMTKTSGAPYCMFNASKIAISLQSASNKQGPLLITAAKRSSVLMDFYTWRNRIYNNAYANAFELQQEEASRFACHSDFLCLVKDGAEGRNPTHAVGLLANMCSNSPLKRDLVSAWTHHISDILDFSVGYTESEKDEIRGDLVSRSYALANSGIARVWQSLCKE